MKPKTVTSRNNTKPQPRLTAIPKASPKIVEPNLAVWIPKPKVVAQGLCLDKMPSVADSRLSDDGSGFFY